MTLHHQPGFTGATIERADHLRLDPAAIAALLRDPRARLLRLAGLDPLLDEAGRLQWDSIAALPDDGEPIFLGLDGETPCFAPLTRIASGGQRAWSIFPLLDLMPPDQAAVFAAARSLIDWHNRHGFCAPCGAPTEAFRAGWGRTCASCNTEHFPRVDPVVIMLAQYEGKVLLGRQPQYPPRRYSALAGFVEPGESLEEAVARELKEEAGITVSGVRYVASQPWPFPGSLMIACIADAAAPEIVLDTNELEDAAWFDRAAVSAALAGERDAPFQAPPHFAIANTLLKAWRDGG